MDLLPAGAANADAVEIVSASATSEIPAARRTVRGRTAGRTSGAGEPLGSTPTRLTRGPALKTVVAAMASTTMISTAALAASAAAPGSAGLGVPTAAAAATARRARALDEAPVNSRIRPLARP